MKIKPLLNKKLKNIIAGATALFLIVQLAVPFGPISSNKLVPKASASSTKTWDFDTASNYTYNSDEVEIISSKAQRKLTWTASGDTDLSGAVLDLLETDTINRVLAVIQDLADTILYSTDAGSTWAPVTVVSDGNTYYFYDMAKRPSDGRVVLVGYWDDAVDNAVSFVSTDDGATWSGPNLFEPINRDAPQSRSVAWDTNNGKFWAGTNRTDNALMYTSSDGITWTHNTNTLTNATDIYDILPISSTVLYAAGESSNPGDSVWYTSDSGSNWALTDNLGGTVAITTSLALGSVAGRYQNILFVGTYNGNTFKSSGDASGGWNGSLDWTNISISGVSRVEDIYLDTKDNILLSGASSLSGGACFFISSDGGSNWSENHPQTSDSRNGPIIRLFNTGVYLVGAYVGAGDGEVYSGTHNIGIPYEVVNKTGVDFASISNFTATVADSSEFKSPYVFHFTISDDGSNWYWYDHVTDNQWESSSGISQSNSATEINDNIDTFMSDLDISSGTFYFKTFMTGNAIPNDNPSAHLDSVAITYTTGTVTITSPNGGENWEPGSTHQITWNKTGTVGQVNLYYYLDGEWDNPDKKFLICDNADGDSGSYTWSPLPNPNSDQVKVRIVSNTDLSITDDSDDYFTIKKRTGPIDPSDKIPPESSVDRLPRIMKAESGPTGPYITVTATAVDPPPDASGVAWVDLYYKKGLDPGSPESDYDYYGSSASTNEEGKYYWTFYVPSLAEQEHYFFFSLAHDAAGNVEDYLDVPDTQTTVDLYPPSVSFTDPADGSKNIDIDYPLTIYFSEAIESGSFQYNISPPVTGLQETWFEDKTWVTINHDSFERNTTYTLTITAGKDTAGRDLAGLPYSFSFITVPPIDPDLSGSHWNPILDQNGNTPPDNKLKPGEVYRYSFDIINSKTATAYVAWESAIPEGAAAWNSSQWSGCYRDGNTIRWGTPDEREELLGGETHNIIFYLKIDFPQDNGTSLPNTAIFTDGVNDLQYKKDLLPVPSVESSPVWNNDILRAKPTVVGRGQNTTLTVKLQNSGDMNANISASITIPQDSEGEGFKFGAFKQDDFGNAQNNENKVTFSGWVNTGDAEKIVQFTAQATNNATEGKYTFNLVITILNGQGIDPMEQNFDVTIKVQVPPPPPPYEDLFIKETDPADQSKVVKLLKAVKVVFSRALSDIGLFDFETIGSPPIDKDKWIPEWNDAQDTVSLKHPDDPFVIGSSYTFKVSAPNLDNDLNEVPNPWSFETVYPYLTFNKPQELKPGDPLVLSFPANTPSPLIEVQFKDKDTEQIYELERPIRLLLSSTSSTGGFDTDPNGDFTLGYIDLEVEESKTSIYYKDSAPSPQGKTYTIYINPTDPQTGNSLGWGTATGFFMITEEPENNENGKLFFTNPPRNLTAGDTTPSEGFTLKIQDKEGNLITFPEDMEIYLYTASNKGIFYNEFYDPLPYLSGSGKSVQVLTPPEPELASLNFYFMNEDPGQLLITASDNYPLSPDTGYANAHQIVQVQAEEKEEEELEEEELEELELEEVEDESGRILDTVVIDPTEARTAPGGSVVFEAKGFDTEGEEITELKFFWFVINGGGTILEEGLKDSPAQTIFTAGETKGIYPNTVLLATKYNGVIKGATATVYVGDVTDLGGPILPSTGPNGLQWFFLGLILMASVALAWVEHYDKTHFAPAGIKS